MTSLKEDFWKLVLVVPWTSPHVFLLCFADFGLYLSRTLRAFLEQTPHNMSSACFLSVEKKLASEAFLEFQRITLMMVFHLSLEKDMFFCLNVLSLSFFLAQHRMGELLQPSTLCRGCFISLI